MIPDFINHVFLKSCESMDEIPDRSIDCCVTSPPYWGLRDYDHGEQIGLERTPAEYVERMVAVFREVWRALRDDGTLWLNIGDSYASAWSCNRGKTHELGVGAPSRDQRTNKLSGDLKEKDLVGIPWMLAFALRADGWYLRSDIIWHKPNPMPSSVTDRPTTAHEYLFLLSKSARYYYDQDAIREPLSPTSLQRLSQDIENQEGSTRANAGGKTNGNMKAVGGGISIRAPKMGKNRLSEGARDQNEVWYDQIKGANKRTVWTVSTEGYFGAHFATFPADLIRPCIMAGSRPDGIVLDPFMGSGTTARVAIEHGRRFVGYELNPEYHKLIQDRLGLFGA